MFQQLVSFASTRLRRRHQQRDSLLAIAACLGMALQPLANAQDKSERTTGDATDTTATDLDRVMVIGRRQNLVGEAISASEGVVGRQDIADRPMLRTGDLLEFVPGLIATSHSGSGKANQYFLRGFNLDHGTDFSTSVDGMPVNMRTHGHGQGYTDLNFLIPETVDGPDLPQGHLLRRCRRFLLGR